MTNNRMTVNNIISGKVTLVNMFEYKMTTDEMTKQNDS
jgi:hypothetical protein